MIYGYVDGRCKVSSTTDEARKEYPEIEEWVCEEIHDQRECLREKQEMRAYDILREMERSIKEFNRYAEGLRNG